MNMGLTFPERVYGSTRHDLVKRSDGVLVLVQEPHLEPKQDYTHTHMNDGELSDQPVVCGDMWLSSNHWCLATSHTQVPGEAGRKPLNPVDVANTNSPDA
jgi:hypothetical protein